MKIAKPLLLVSTPVGVVWGVTVAYRMHAWLGWLMMALLSVISIFIGYTVHVIRREQRQQTTGAQLTRPKVT
ncbi:MAG TPA: hypothetical protein VG962_12410 [Steroidobacteraceae bacterium]|nr:hypothetical protein [Steroidobacteraceae bacterium]